MSKLTLVAEESTPSLLAVTLPGLLAGAMKASWVADAVVAVTAAETHTTPENTQYILDGVHSRNIDLYCYSIIHYSSNLLALSRFVTEAMFFITAW